MTKNGQSPCVIAHEIVKFGLCKIISLLVEMTKHGKKSLVIVDKIEKFGFSELLDNTSK